MNSDVGIDVAVRRIEIDPQVLHPAVIQGETGAEADSIGPDHKGFVEPKFPAFRQIDRKWFVACE